MKKVLQIAVICAVISACRGGLFSPSSTLVEEAETLAREQRYDEAIELYRKHMERRLTVSDRPDWENPYLYLLTIGDLELRRGNVQKALDIYEQAEKSGVSSALVSDRYRGVAADYEERQELEQAIAILKKYRERDPLLFDGMLDRLSKQIVADEDSRAHR